MHRLHHGAEIFLDARGFGGGNAERIHRLRSIQTQQITRPRRHAQHAEHRGRMPATIVSLKTENTPDPRHRLQPHHIRLKQLAAR